MPPVFRWIRANSVAYLIAVLATAAVVGAGALVLSIADRENGLRDAQTEIAELSSLTGVLRDQALTAFADRQPGRADATLNTEIETAALRAAREIEAHWSDPTVDVLKVDREFTGKAEEAPEQATLLNAVIEIGDSLGLQTIAEGVETHAQARRLRALRYRLGQGYLFSRPVPATAVEELLRSPAKVT